MSMPSPTGTNWPDAMRPLELRRQARVIANFAEYLADDVRGHPEQAREAMGALAEWCEGDHELMVHARTEVLRNRRSEPVNALENNRHAVQLLDLVNSAS